MKRPYSAALPLFLIASAWGQQSPAPIIRPGAPGQDSTTLSAAAAVTPVRPPAEADVSFMQGMIMHHAQAVEMTDLMKTRTHNKALLELGQRIGISQTDEIGFMKQWLVDRGRPTGMDRMSMHHDMEHMSGMKMDMPMLMPGMLTPEQMKALAQASGAKFDHLFLTGMIQHHTGALIMVEDLFATAGAGQETVLFDFATDIDNTQRAEIEIMKNMLLKEKK
jgi:uncharacterized protein (DUF305 family)